MILAAVALSLQPAPAVPMVDARAASHAFLSICVRHVGDQEALRAAIRSSPLRFVRARDEGRFEVYHAPGATIRSEPGLGCALEATLPSRGAGIGAIDLVAQATGRPVTPGGTNRAGSGARYMWREPVAGQPGMSARLDWGPIGVPPDAPARLFFWTYLRTAP